MQASCFAFTPVKQNQAVKPSLFLQEKYVKRKTDKYMVRAAVQRPTARSLAEALFAWRPEKIQYMRPDTLAMLLTMANIGAHGRALILDGCGGLVTGAVAERMGGFGQVRFSRKGAANPRPTLQDAFLHALTTHTMMAFALNEHQF